MNWGQTRPVGQNPIGICPKCQIVLDDHGLKDRLPVCLPPGFVASQPYEKYGPSKEPPKEYA